MTDAVSLNGLLSLTSEQRNPRTADIDILPTAEILSRINDEDKRVAFAVERELPNVTRAVDLVVNALRSGGRLVYIGAGTSGRLGVLDASECPPTFSVPADMVIGLIGGGDTALRTAVEGAEDDPAQGEADLRAIGLAPSDIVVGVAASGRTPYVLGALDYARHIGASTVGLTCVAASDLSRCVDVIIAPLVGPEVLTGSTRMKSGTAQKMVLNMISTAAMIRMGKTYRNLMVDLSISNQKLAARAAGILCDVTGATEAEAKQLIAESGDDLKTAILMKLTGLDRTSARRRLDAAGGFLRHAIDSAADGPSVVRMDRRSVR